MTATVDITRIDNQGTEEPVYHAATRTLAEALGLVASHAPAPVNRSVRMRLESDDGGDVQIGMVSAAIAIYP